MLRVYHGGRNAAHRARERALAALGVDVTLVVPTAWPEPDAAPVVEEFPLVELPVRRPGDVNRHAYRDVRAIARVLRSADAEVLDIHEEPVSLATRQWLAAAPAGVPVVMYTAQNLDKRFPPPFSTYERRAYRRADALYPCSRQAAAVARGKGFAGPIEVLPLGYDSDLFRPGAQSLEGEVRLALFGRLVPEKGVLDAVRVLARVCRERPARLLLVGEGPEESHACSLASELGVGERVEVLAWRGAADVAALYRETHVALVPSRPTETWVEQYGRVVLEAQASGAVVAAYASGAVPEVGGDAALLSPVGDVAALADSILRVLEDSQVYESRRARGIELAGERTWARVAERQAALYERVAAGAFERLALPRSPGARRARARAEFGKTAEAAAGVRPFALPVLRRRSSLSRALAAVIDATAEVPHRRSTAR